MASWTLNGKTRRTVVKQWYMARAANVLEKFEGNDFGYLIGPSNLRSEILAELGQLDDDDRILEAAACVCENKVKAKDAVAMIRAWRNGKTSPGDSDVLANEITTLIRSYPVRHPGVTYEQDRNASAGRTGGTGPASAPPKSAAQPPPWPSESAGPGRAPRHAAPRYCRSGAESRRRGRASDSNGEKTTTFVVADVHY